MLIMTKLVSASQRELSILCILATEVCTVSAVCKTLYYIQSHLKIRVKCVLGAQLMPNSLFWQFSTHFYFQINFAVVQLQK